MTEEKLIIDLNFENSRGHFLRAIQHQLDIVTLLLAGAARVTAQESQPHGFHNFSPAHGASLPHEQTQTKAINWLNTCFLRDSIEATDQFLGRCLSFCFAINLAGKGNTTTSHLDEIVRLAPQRHHKLHFPAKLLELEKKYGVKPNFSEHVISLNKLRTCLVHRLGVVSELDANKGDHLVAQWVSSKMVLRGLETGAELVLTEPGQGLEEDAMLEMHIVEHEKAFPVGSSIALEPYDTYSTIFTLWRFGLACSEAVELFARSTGLPVRKV